MKRTTVLVVVLIIFIVAIAAYFIFGNKNGVSGLFGGGTASSGEEQRATGIEGGMSSSEVPSGDTLAIGSSGGSITVKNFYRGALGVIEESEVVMDRTDAYELDYSRADSSFAATLLRGPVAQTRAEAEARLLDILGISRSDACRLSVSVVIPVSVDASLGGRSYPLSFCAKGGF